MIDALNKDVSVTVRVYAVVLAALEGRGFGALATKRYSGDAKETA